MKLSEAIRLGAMMRKQAIGAPYRDDGSCALAAAAEAVGDGYYALFNQQPCPLWPSLVLPNLCPECGRTNFRAQFSLVTHLNDTHAWTRERIADFVERYELMPEPKTITEPATTLAE